MKKIFFIFGRFQPPHIGHVRMIQNGARMAKQMGAEFRIYTSHSHDSKTNPLPYRDKITFLRQIFPGLNIIDDSSAISAFAICRKLSDAGYTDVTMGAGGDRVQEFKKQIGKYIMPASNPFFDKTKNFNFEKFDVVNLDDRRGGFSGTAMRELIKKNDLKKFVGLAPTKDRNLATKIFTTAKKYLKEESLMESSINIRGLQILKNPSALEFKNFLEGSQTKNVRVLKYKESWYVIDSYKGIHSDILARILPREKYLKIEMEGSDNWRIANKIAAFSIRLRMGQLHYFSDLREDPDYAYYLVKNDKKFEEMIGYYDMFFEDRLYQKSQRKKKKVNWKMKPKELKTKIQRDIDMNLAEAIRGKWLRWKKDKRDKHQPPPPRKKVDSKLVNKLVVKPTPKPKQTVAKLRKKVTVKKTSPKFFVWPSDISSGSKQAVIPSSSFTSLPSVSKKFEPKNKPKTATKRRQTAIIRPYDYSSELKIYKNPDASSFDRAIKVAGVGVRVLRFNRDWYVWSWYQFIHSDVIEKFVKMSDEDRTKVRKYNQGGFGLPHVKAAMVKDFSIIGIQLAVVGNEKKLMPTSDVIGDDNMSYIINELKKDRKFRAMTKNWTVTGLNGKGELFEPVSKIKKKKFSMNRSELLSKIQRDIDMNLAEEMSHKDFQKILKGFIDFTATDLGIDSLPSIQYKTDGDQGEQPSFGGYQPHNKILTIATKNRHPMDIFRTVAHELVHHKQNLEGRLGKTAHEGDDGSEIENEANSRAAVTMRRFGKANPHMFGHSYVTEENLYEGLYDKGIFKAVFLAGGSGSGKDFILKTCIEGNGLKELNSDLPFELLMKRNHIPLTMEPKNAKRDRIRGRAKEITMDQKKLQLAGRIGVIVNSTADDYSKIAELKKNYESLGYDTMMVFVSTSNKTSRQRNVKRGELGGRRVPEEIRFKKWMGSNKNKDKFQQLFGSNFISINNNTDLQSSSGEEKVRFDKDRLTVFKRVKSFVESPLKNPIAQEWIKAEKTRRGISESDEKFDNMLNEIGGAGNWGTGKLTGRYQQDTPGQHIGFHDMKPLDMIKFHREKQYKENNSLKRIPIGKDRIGSEYGFPKSPTMGDNQTFPNDSVNDPISRWMVKENTIKTFRKRYGKLFKKKLEEAARSITRSESLDDPYSPMGGVTPNSSNKDEVRPDSPNQIDREKQSLFGFRLKNQKKLNTR